MAALSRTRIPAAADNLERLVTNEGSSPLESIKTSQDSILADMNRILANMQKWEGYQEAVALLREILKMQGNLNQEVKKQLEDRSSAVLRAPGRPRERPSRLRRLFAAQGLE